MALVPEYLNGDSVIETTPAFTDTTLTIFSFEPHIETTLMVICLMVIGDGSFNGATHDGLNLEIAHNAENATAKSFILYLPNPNITISDIQIGIKTGFTTAKAVVACFKNTDTESVIHQISQYDFDVSEGLTTDIITSTDNCLIVDSLAVTGGVELSSFESELLANEDGSTLAGAQYVIKETAGTQGMAWGWAGEAPAAHTLVAFTPLLDLPPNNRKPDMFQSL